MSYVHPRPEFEHALPPLPAAAEPPAVSAVQRLWQRDGIRQVVVLILIAAAWEGAARWAGNDLLLPGFLQAAQAWMTDLRNGELIARTAASLSLLLRGYALGVVLALTLSALAVATRPGRDVLNTLTSLFNPLPAIALLPLALLWFGLGQGSLIFVLVHAVLWPLALSTLSGFQGVPETLRMAGRNYGLRGLRYVLHILVPSALPAILSGLRIGWAFAWRTLIAAELFFGASSGRGGLGWYIFQNRNELMTDRVFAGLATVVLIGWLVERFVFDTIERLTVRRWGVQR
ncbi:MAG: ABC transporter permease [Rubrivivax sp.]|nr:MAG: ABC transporter permease [Rubrivivax sp.]